MFWRIQLERNQQVFLVWCLGLFFPLRMSSVCKLNSHWLKGRKRNGSKDRNPQPPLHQGARVTTQEGCITSCFPFSAFEYEATEIQRVWNTPVFGLFFTWCPARHPGCFCPETATHPPERQHPEPQAHLGLEGGPPAFKARCSCPSLSDTGSRLPIP